MGSKSGLDLLSDAIYTDNMALLIKITKDESGMRLDRWMKKHYPSLPFSHVAKLLRTGQVRVNGGRSKPDRRVEEGQEVRLPPSLQDEATKPAPPPRINKHLLHQLREAILYQDDHLVIINKPQGLAVQGGSKQKTHLDAMLGDLLPKQTERLKLVHRLDKDTSGVLILAKSRRAAEELTHNFQSKEIQKTYLAITIGVPRPEQGEIDARLAKHRIGGSEKMVVDHDGDKAISTYKVSEALAKKFALVELSPITGRTHQLRVHMEHIGTPILGDGKYKGTREQPEGFVKKLHLHASRLVFSHPLIKGKTIDITAPLPEHFMASCEKLGFETSN